MLPRYNYLGAGAKHKVLKKWLDRARKYTRYVDMTAGSCNQPYAINRTHGIPVGVNDANYYSHSIAKALLKREHPTDLRVLRDIVARASAEDRPVGWWPPEFSSARSTPFLTWVIKLARETLPDAEAHFVLANVGSTIMSKLTFRARGFDKKRLRTWGPDQLSPTLIGLCERRNEYIAWHPENQCTSEHVLDARLNMKGATVNIDPAWPYHSTPLINPYDLYLTVGDLLRGRPRPFSFWKDPTNPAAVVSEFCSWVRSFFDRGAAEVLIWNQTTNHPSKEQLRAGLAKRFGNCTSILEVMQQTVNDDDDEFEDYVLRIGR